jgi:CxC6 like cysteine cluster associated with KDZ transposases
MYSFHASASAYVEFWNNSFGKTQQDVFQFSCRQIWQAFVQESICTIAASANTEISVQDNLAIDEITKEAFSILGENGVIRAADQHACSECTHNYIATTSNSTPTAHSAAVVGVDDKEVDDEDIEQSSHQAADSGSSSSGSTSASTSDSGMDVDKAPVKMVVVDGTCFGPKHCAYKICANDLFNYGSGVFCERHEKDYGAKCCVRNCNNFKLRQ